MYCSRCVLLQAASFPVAPLAQSAPLPAKSVTCINIGLFARYNDERPLQLPFVGTFFCSQQKISLIERSVGAAFHSYPFRRFVIILRWQPGCPQVSARPSATAKEGRRHGYDACSLPPAILAGILQMAAILSVNGRNGAVSHRNRAQPSKCYFPPSAFAPQIARQTVRPRSAPANAQKARPRYAARRSSSGVGFARRPDVKCAGLFPPGATKKRNRITTSTAAGILRSKR